MRALIATLAVALTLGGCGMAPDEALAETEAELQSIIDEAVTATDLPVTRRWDPPGLFLGCDDGTERLAQKVNADDPDELEPYFEALLAHFQDRGWELADGAEFTDEASGPSTSAFLMRDGYEAIVDLVRGTEGTGVDLEVLSPCRELRR